MGIFLSLFNRFQDKRILLLGLDAAGKTTILYKLRLGEVVTTIPTIGFNVEEVVYKSMKMVVWDVGGQERIRKLWRHYYEKSDALIFVVDSNDPERFSEAHDEIHAVLSDDLLRGIPTLVFANKSDMKGAHPVTELIASLEMGKLHQHPWLVQASSAITGDGLYEGLDWLAKTLSTTTPKHK